MKQTNERDAPTTMTDVEQFAQDIIGHEEAMRYITYGFVQAVKVLPLLDEPPQAS